MLDKDLLNYLGPKKKLIFIATIFNLLNLLFGVLITASLIYLIFEIINNNYNYIYLNLIILAVSIILKIAATKQVSIISTQLSDYVVYKLREDTYNKFLSLEGNTCFTTSEMAQLSTEGIEQLRLYYSIYLPSFFYAMLGPVILFIIFLFLDVPVAFLYLACVPLIPMSIILVSKWAKRIFNKYWNIYTSLGDSFLDNTSGMKELKIFLYDEIRQKEMMESSEDFRKITMKVLTMQLASVTIMDMVAFGGAGVGIFLALNHMLDGLSVYYALFIILVGAEFFLPMRALGSAFHVAMNGATAGKKIIKLFSLEEVKRKNLKVDKIQNVKVCNLNFSYNEKKVLEDINLKIEKGFYSIVGLSGSGKSTLAKVLVNILKEYKGNVLYNGNLSVNEVDKHSFYQHVSYISANTYLFHKSVRESFKFYNENITEEEMYQLLDKVSLTDFIERNNGLDFVINESATNVSGGEKQRLVLAYYLAKEYDFYVFDEATSNIDSLSEEIILKNIQELAKTKMVLFITHRIKNVIDAKYIYYLDDKKIIEEGCPKNLLDIDSKFKELYEIQTKQEALV